MADNFTALNASDATITGSADDIGGGVLAPHVKLLDATDGSSTPIGVAAHPLRTDPTGTTTQPVSGTITADLGTLNGAATAANQTASGNSLSSIDGKLTGVAQDGTDVTGASMPSGGAGIRGWLSALYTALVARLPVLTLVSGALKVDNSAVTQPVSGTVTANLGTIGTAATAAKQDTGNTSLASIDGKLPALGQALAGASTPVVLPAAQITTLTPPAAITGFATETTLGTRLSESDFDTKMGALTETAPASDTASSGVNGRLQRIAQRLSSILALLPSALTGSGNFKAALAESTATVTVAQGTAASLKTQAEAYQGGTAVGSANPLEVSLRAVADSAPATANVTVADSASSTAAGASSQSIVTGSPTANSTAAFSLVGRDTVAVQITGTWTGTLAFEASYDGGTTWYTRSVHLVGTNSNVASVTANALGVAQVAGATNFRVRATAAMTGTATVGVAETVNEAAFYLINTPQLADGTTPTQKLAIDASGAASENLTKLGGTAVDTNSGNKSAGTLRVVLATDQPALSNAQPAITNDVTATGSITANAQTVSVALNGRPTVAVQITGTFVATVQFEASVDGSTYFSIAGHPSAGGPNATAATATGAWQFNVSGYMSFRVRCSAYTSGTVVVSLCSSVGASITPGRVRTTSPKTTWISSNGTPISTATNTQAVAAPGAGSHLKVVRIHAQNKHATVATDVDWCEGSGGTRVWETYCPAAGGVASPRLDGSWELPSNTALYIRTSGAATVVWTVGYDIVPD